MRLPWPVFFRNVPFCCKMLLEEVRVGLLGYRLPCLQSHRPGSPLALRSGSLRRKAFLADKPERAIGQVPFVAPGIGSALFRGMLACPGHGQAA